MTENEQHIESLTRSSLLAKNTIYNLLGQIAPLIAALVAIPVLLRALGAERFGVLGIAWVVLGYFSLFDLGLGRVMTMMIAEKLGSERLENISSIIWTGLGFMLVLGIVMMFVLLALTPLFVHSLLKIPPPLLTESFRAFLLLAACVPIVIITTGLRAILEAYQKFGIVNIIRTLNGMLLYLAPLAILPFTASIFYVVAVLTGVRFIVAFFYLMACRRQIDAMRNRPTFRKHLIKPMLKLGGWMSVSNIIGPVMVYFDRFLMGIWLSVTAVAYYVTPYELISKAMVITTSVVRVLFPAFSMSIRNEPQRAADLYSRGNRILLLLFFPFTLTVVVFAPWGLKLWLGAEFIVQSVKVMQWLAVGVMVNAFGQVAFAAIQAAGRPDITAKLHVLEMPFYLASLYFFIGWFGIAGAAMAWTVRICIDTFILLHIAERLLKSNVRFASQIKIILLSSLGLLASLIYIDMSLSTMILVFVLGSAGAILSFGTILVHKSEWRQVFHRLKRFV